MASIAPITNGIRQPHALNLRRSQKHLLASSSTRMAHNCPPMSVIYRKPRNPDVFVRDPVRYRAGAALAAETESLNHAREAEQDGS
jgi:hypothetical protein